MSDADLVHWALEAVVSDLDHRAKVCRNPAWVHGPRTRVKAEPKEAALYESIAARLTILTLLQRTVAA